MYTWEDEVLYKWMYVVGKFCGKFRVLGGKKMPRGVWAVDRVEEARLCLGMAAQAGMGELVLAVGL